MKILNVIGISPGIAIGRLYRYASEEIVIAPRSCKDPDLEIEKLTWALETAQVQLQEVYQKALQSTGEAEAEIFEAHQLLLEDPDLLEKVHAYVQQDRYTVEYAWYRSILDYESVIGGLDDEYFAARAVDIRDVGQRVLRILLGTDQSARLERPSIIVAKELSPSDTVSFDKDNILALCTVSGGPTSHVAILSRALGIPAVVGIGPWFEELIDGAEVIVDGIQGRLVLNPDGEMIKKYEQISLEYRATFQKAFLKTRLPARTIDDCQVEVVANIGSPGEAAAAVEFGAEGVGLLRTEFLFLDREFPPTEEEQLEVYREILSHFGRLPVVARTLDIGGDKPASYLKIDEEQNPFLGLRGTRLALKREGVFKTQIRALLRAGSGYNLKIMFPMVGTVAEVKAIQLILAACREELRGTGKAFTEMAEIGIMIEVPSAAILADLLIRHVDFFSIGTNDLTQYTLAVDRTNPNVAEHADALDPAVLRLIQMVIEASHRHGKWTGLCGELAGDPLAAPLLLGMHLDEFSMNSRAIPLVKQRIRNFSMARAEEIARAALQLSTAQEVHSFLEETNAEG